MITSIKTVAIYVEDQNRALEFYTTKLGFEVRRKEQMTANVHWIELAPKGGQTCLVIYPKAMMKDWRERKPSIVFACADARATSEELKSRGVVFLDPPKDMSWGTFATFRDPDGNELVLTSPPHGK